MFDCVLYKQHDLGHLRLPLPMYVCTPDCGSVLVVSEGLCLMMHTASAVHVMCFGQMLQRHGTPTVLYVVNVVSVCVIRI